MKKTMNEDLPYEQQMKPILASYDRLVEENQNLKNRVAELEKALNSASNESERKYNAEISDIINTCKQRGEKLEWIQKTLEDYLVSLGIELPQYRTVSKVVKMIVKI
jgi:hypothetical protein|nr:MAG TPA: hypothetical protein [Caudoviricetes sp.]